MVAIVLANGNQPFLNQSLINLHARFDKPLVFFFLFAYQKDITYIFDKQKEKKTSTVLTAYNHVVPIFSTLSLKWKRLGIN